MKPARLLIAGFFVLLAGCSVDPDLSELKSYLDEVKARPKGSIEPLPSFQPYEAFTYSASAMRSPFQPPVKIDLAKREKGSQEIKPDETRIKQFLEGFNIENFSMVGTLASQGSIYGLLKGGEGVHRVKIGDYLGRNHGRIIGIAEGEIDVMEIVPDGEGGWLERPRSLSLKERS